MLAICTRSVDLHYPKIEVVALAGITAILLGVGIYLLKCTSPMPAAKISGIYLSAAGSIALAVTALVLGRRIFSKM